jgi:hemerythrin
MWSGAGPTLESASMSINIQWDRKFEVGHERIDFEHQIFVGLIRDLSMEADKNPKGMRNARILREIQKYAEFHFISEENIMADLDYPERDAHRQSHGMILAELNDRIQQYHAGQDSAVGIVSFLFQWFALHTTNEDRRIINYVKSAPPG